MCRAHTLTPYSAGAQQPVPASDDASAARKQLVISSGRVTNTRKGNLTSAVRLSFGQLDKGAANAIGSC